MPKKLILLIGAPGSGKTTDAKLIAQKHSKDITSYSTGELIKQEINNNTAIGHIAKGFVEKGDLVPTAIVVETIVDTVNNAPTNVVLLDGFPGKEKQLQYFCDYIFNNDKIQLISVIEVKVSEETAKKRWLDAGRSIEVFEHEMKSYTEIVNEIEQHFSDKHILKIINGEQGLDNVVNEIDAHLESTCVSL